MGLFTWFARKGVVGGTARWAGRNYLRIHRLNPQLSPNQVIVSLIDARYSVFNESEKRNLALQRIGKAEGLALLVVIILDIETRFSDCNAKATSLFYEVIYEELEKCGIPSKLLY